MELYEEALEDMKRLVQHGKSVDEAASHAFHRFGIDKDELLKLWREYVTASNT